MKIKYLFFILCICLLEKNFAQHTEEIFLQANNAYDQNDLKKASELYASIKNKGEAVWYNLGICYYKQERWVDALHCFLQAERQASWDSFFDIEYALAQVRTKLGHTQQETMLSGITYSLKKIASSYSLFAWQTIFIIVWILMIVNFVLFYRKKNYFIVGILLFFALVAGALLMIKYMLLYEKQAIVNASNVTVLLGPDDQFSTIGSVSLGQEVAILMHEDGWYKVQYNAHRGWLRKDNLTIVN